MAEEQAKTRYQITLRKCTDGQNPVITVSTLSKERYDIIQGLIHDRKVDANGQKVLRKGGNRK